MAHPQDLMSDDEGHVQTQALRQQLHALSDDDLLALAYAFVAKPARLRLYMEALLHKGSKRSVFAAFLLACDLARRGDPDCKNDVASQRARFLKLRSSPKKLKRLIGGAAYLQEAWQAFASDTDAQPFDAHARAPNGLGVGSFSSSLIDPLSPSDKAPEAEETRLLQDGGTAKAQVAAVMLDGFRRATDVFLGGVQGVAAYDGRAGFRLGTQSQQTRLETYLNALAQAYETVAPARGMQALVLLFWGDSLKPKTLFGAQNLKRQEVLRAGLRTWVQHPDAVADVAGVLGHMHAHKDVWPNIAMEMMNYLAWVLARQQAKAGISCVDGDVGAYSAV